MTRVSHASSHRGAHAPATLERPRAVAQKKKKPYKIVLEAVTQEKRKLQSILTYHDQAPQGFGYIPIGNPEFTEWCKEQCRQRNLDVHIVSAKPKNKTHADPEKLSHHVHRIGHHFPLEIIDLACKKFGYQFSEKHGLQKQKTRPTTYGAEYFERGIADYQQRQRLHGRPVTEKESKDHIRGAIREIFPKIPEADLASIVNHAFEEGTNRVGNAKELSLARRVQLAVVAHIRHTYTEYDNILKTGSWSEARQKVEHVSLAKLKEWRDEAGEASNELEETFREVIVLDDDDEESSDDESANADEREPSMEIVSSRATARDLQPEPFDRMHAYAPYVGRGPRRTIILQPVPPRSRPLIPASEGTHRTLQASVDLRTLPPVTEPMRFRPEPFRLAHGRPIDLRAREPVMRDAHSMQMRDSDGQLYNLRPIDGFRDDGRVRRIEGPPRIAYEPRPAAVSRYARDDYVQAPPRIMSEGNRPSRPVLGSSSRRTSDQDVVLPSIEREPDGVASPRRAVDAPHQFRHDRNSASVSYANVQSPKRKSFPASVYNPDEHYPEPVPKRMRPIYNDQTFAQVGPSLPGAPRARHHEPAESYHRPRAQPYHQSIDLTSSPGRPPHGAQRDMYEPVRPRPTTGPNNQAYVLAPSRSPMRDVRGAYHQVPLRESSRTYMPEYDRMYDGRVLPHVDSNALREDAARFQSEGGRYLRGGADYRGYTQL